MKNLILKIRALVVKVDLDVKDHCFLAVIYQFVIVLPLYAYYGKTGGLLAVIFGLVLALVWELYNKRFSVKDVGVFVITLLPMVIVMLNS